MPRPYRMKARADSAEATRRRVLEAARDTILAGTSPAFSMSAVARRARVSRSTLYATYGSVGGLVGAVMFDAQLRAGFDRVLEVFNLPDAAEAMRRALPLGAQMLGSDYELTRRVLMLARLEPSVMTGLAVGEETRAGGMRYQAGRLAEQGKLRPGVSTEEAAALLWQLTSFETYDGLHTTWGMDATQVGDFIAGVAARALLRD